MSRSPFSDADPVDYTADIVLHEHREAELDELSEVAYRTLRADINTEDERLKVGSTWDGSVKVKATQYVGVVSLPDGPTIEIRPKVSNVNLLWMLKYAQKVGVSTIEQDTPFTTGQTFIEALAAIYQAELKIVLRLGLYRDYRQVSNAEKYLCGRLDLQQQLQRQGLTPTRFECVYDELTYDTVVNQALLYVTTILGRLVQDKDLSKSLSRCRQLLRRKVTLAPIRLADIEQVELTRLTDHYTDIFRLTKLVLRSVFIRDLRAGDRASFALLTDMNQMFEAVVERSVAEAINIRDDLTVRTQDPSDKLLEGKPKVSIRPDLLLRDSNNEAVLVGDAKWKLGQPQNSDIYQIVAYQIAHDVPGVLIYPEQEAAVEAEYEIRNGHQLHIIELPIKQERNSFEQFRDQLRDRLSEKLLPLITHS